MKLVQILLLLAISATPWTAHALTIGDYKQLLKKQPDQVDLYINGVGVGTSWANTFNRRGGLPQLYCQPQALAMNVENYKQAIEDEIERHPDKYSDDLPVEIALIHGLQRMFPCAS